MKTKKYLFIGLLALITVTTSWAANSATGGVLFQGRIFDILTPPTPDTLEIVIEMPVSDNEDYSYKHPVMFRAKIKNSDQILKNTNRNPKYLWESDRQGKFGESMELEHKLSKGKHLITCTVTDNNGNRGKTSKYVNIINTPPEIKIKSPAPSVTIKKGDPVLLEADVYDREDQVIPDISISWKCNLDGEIGRGKTITTDKLSPGIHKITVSAKDSEGAISKSDIVFTIK